MHHIMFRATLLMVATSWALSGCQTTEQATVLETATELAAWVDIGGNVSKPQAMEIPAQGLTLLQAYQRAGGLQRTPGVDADSGEIWMVVLQRREESQIQKYYLPLSLVQLELAGQIPLRQGDSIQLVSFEDTTLALTPSTDANHQITVTGWIARPGTYAIVDSNQTVSDIPTDQYAGPYDTGTGSANLIVLTRRGISPLVREHFFVPLVEPLSKDDLLKARLQNGDRYHYTRLELDPLIMSAVIQPVLDARKAARIAASGQRATSLGGQAARARQAVEAQRNQWTQQRQSLSGSLNLPAIRWPVPMLR